MKLKKTYFFLMTVLLGFAIEFYCVVLPLEIFTIVLIIILGNGGSMSGMDFSSMIFMFIVGIGCFKKPFRFLTGSGVSRKTFLTATLLTGISAPGILIGAGTLNTLILKALPIFSMEYINLFENAFGLDIFGINFMKYLGFNLSGYLCSFVMGYFIVSLTYRLSTKMRVAFFVGVPVLIAYVLPRLTSRFGTISINPFQTLGSSILTEAVIIVVLGVLSWRIVSTASHSAN